MGARPTKTRIEIRPYLLKGAFEIGTHKGNNKKPLGTKGSEMHN